MKCSVLGNVQKQKVFLTAFGRFKGGGGSIKSVKGPKESTKTLKQDNWQLLTAKGH